MSVLSIVLLILGVLMLIEGSMVIFLPKFSLKMFRRFMKNTEKHLKTWGIGEIILAIIIIILSMRL